MIVKDEETVIERALRSALPFITTYMIVDTGSTDRTKEIIAQVMADVSGQIVDRPWVSFGQNRSEALALCDGQMEWALMLDADDTLEGTVPPPEVYSQSHLDAFMIRIIHGAIIHQRTQIFRTGIGWGYEGVVHEYATCRSKTQAVIGSLPPETYMVTRCEGARSKDPNKYIKDALLLETALLKEPTNHRTIFYLAQSYRDAGQPDVARRYYQRYLDLSGGWIQERYIAHVQLIAMVPEQEKLQLTWSAIELCPDRLEAPCAYLRWRRGAGLPATHQSYAIAAAVTNRKPVQTYLFATPAIYEWGMDDELAIVAFATGHFREAYDAAMRCVLGTGDRAMQENALRNAKAAQERMVSRT
jgi:hypothetical protein